MARVKMPTLGAFDAADSLTLQFVEPTQTLVAGASSVQSSAFVAEETRCVRIVCAQDSWVEIGANPSASSVNGTYMVAGVPEAFKCGPGDKVAVLQATTGGNVYVRPAK